MPSVSKTMLFKKATIETDFPPLTLQDMLEKTYSNKNCRTARSRFCAFGEEIRLINNYGTAFNSMQVGTFVSFVPGRTAFTLRWDEGNVLTYHQLAPDTESALVGNTLYFGVMGNNLAIIQQGTLKIEAFEEYLQWLLTERYEDVEAVHGFCFEDYEPQNRIEKVRYLELTVQAHVEQGQDGKLFVVGNGNELLPSLFPSDVVSLDKLHHDSIITAKIRLAVQKRPRLDAAQFDYLDDLADHFREENFQFYTFETQSGMCISNIKNFRLSKTVALPCTEDRELHPEAVWEAMYKWLTDVENL